MPKQPNQLSDKQYETIGRQLVNLYETGYFDRRKAYKQTFIKGLLGGFGGVIGATIVVALILWALSLFHRVPLVGPFANRIRTTIQSEKH